MYSSSGSLENLINQQRNEMYEVALKEGMLSPKTIEVSKKLDALLNKYQSNMNS